jgi:mono/diheme cytochrome c family protein
MQPLPISSRSFHRLAAIVTAPLMCMALVCAQVVLTGCSTVPPDPVAEVAKPEVVARGKAIVNGLASCGFCHGAAPTPDSPLSGGRVFHDLYGPVVAPNITQADSALGQWSAAEMQQLFRSGTRPDGTQISNELHRGFAWMSDQDLNSVVTYLRTIKAEGEQQPRREVSFLDRNTKGFWESSREVRGYVPQLNRGFAVEYGKYLADNVANCSSCHDMPAGVLSSTQYLGGGTTVRIGDESKVAPGLTTSAEVGLGEWSEDQIVSYLQSGQTPSGRMVDRQFCPVGFYALADRSDLVAIAKFLKTVK